MKERILAETERLFWKYGVRSVTMEDIAKQLGISKKTIYQHFTDKEEILYQVMLDKMVRNQSEMDCMPAKMANPIEEILSVMTMIQQQADQVNPNFLIDIRRYYPKAYSLFRQYKEQFIVQSILENIQNGISLGLYRSDVNPTIMARLRVEQIELAFNCDIFPTNEYSMLEIQRELMHHFVRGLLTEKGFTIYNEHVNAKNEYNQSVYEKK